MTLNISMMNLSSCVCLLWRNIHPSPCYCCSVAKSCQTLQPHMVAECQVPLFTTISQSLIKFPSTELVMLSNHLILCLPLVLFPSIFPNISEVKVTQSCLTLCKPMDSLVHGILQARILEWVAFPFSRLSSQPRDRTHVSHTAGRFFTS